MEVEVENWYPVKEKDLNKYTRYSTWKEMTFPVFMLTYFVFGYVTITILNSVVESTLFNGVTVSLSGFVVAFIVLFITSRYFSAPMNRIEFLACMINKIHNDIKSGKIESDVNRKKILNDLKTFKKYSRIEQKRVHYTIFKKEMENQIEFFSQLHSLPDRIYYSITSGNIEKFKVDELKKLANAIYNDSETKMEIINRISKENPEKKVFEKNFEDSVRRLVRGQIAKFVFASIICIAAFYGIVYSFLEIDTNTSFLGFIAVITTIAIIIFKPSQNKSNL